MRKELISRWSALLAATALAATLGCAKKEDGAKASVDDAVATGGAQDVGAAPGQSPEGASGARDGDPDDKTRHEVMVENAKNAIPTIARDERTNAAGAAGADPNSDPELANARKELAKTANGQAVPTSTTRIADTETYTVTVDAPRGKAKQDSALQVVIKPKSGWKLNMEFPTKLKVEPPAGVTVAKKTLRKGDAAVFSEKQGATWKVSYQAGSAGQKKFAGELKFAVCTDATCDPKRETLAFAVAVE